MATPKNAKIIISRNLPSYGWNTSFTILLDGVEVGRLPMGKSITLEVEPGRHTLVGRTTRGVKSKDMPREFTLSFGEDLRLTCRMRASLGFTRPIIDFDLGTSGRTLAHRDRQGAAITTNRALSTMRGRMCQVVETEQYELPLGDETRIIDNSRGASEVTRTFRVSRAWNKTLVVSDTSSRQSGAKGGLSAWIVSLAGFVESALEEHYSRSDQEQQVFEETVTVTVPPRTYSSIVFSWKELRQRGYVDVSEGIDSAKVPYEFVLGVTFDQRQVDVA